MDIRFRGRRLPAAPLLFLLLASPGRAHEEPSTTTTLVRPEPLPEKLSSLIVQVDEALAPQIIVANRGGDVLEVLDPQGAAFLRIGPEGVRANHRNPFWYRTYSPSGTTAIPKDARNRPDGTTEWILVSDEPSWGWFDPRIRRDREGSDRRTTWSIPVRIGAEATAIRGRFEEVDLGAGDTRARITKGRKPFPGVRVTMLPGRVPGLFLVNDGEASVVVLGRKGEPFLRIGAEESDGTWANLRSPTWFEVARSRGTMVQEQIDPSAEPEWQRVSGASRYGWVEFRTWVDVRDVPEEVRRRSEPTTLRKWAIPLVRDEQRREVHGETRWLPGDG